MRTPWLRAALTTSFMRGAISETRPEAPLHQCLSHMSQMTTAVSLALQSRSREAVSKRLVSFSERNWARVSRLSRPDAAKPADWQKQAMARVAMQTNLIGSLFGLLSMPHIQVRA